MARDLYFNQDGNFKIVQFTDIHFSDDNGKDHRTTQLMCKIIQEEKPDFIIATGDTVYGPHNSLHISKALSPIVNANVPWSYTFGNHDTEEGEGYDKLFSIITSLPNCYVYNADDTISGTGNHYLKIKNTKGETKWVLFGIDSGSYNLIPHIGGYDYIKGDQIAWYKKVNKELERENQSFSTLVFMHIPLPEYKEVWKNEICFGEKREEVCCSSINSGFFTAVLETGHTKGIFAGHDHVNDYMGSLYGVTLAYGRATGFNTYGHEDFQRGARIIQLNENNLEAFHTYIRLEDGTAIKDQ